MNTTLDRSQKQALARFWQQRARGERTTAVAFEHIKGDLTARAAGPLLVRMAERAVGDEYRHAEACMRWAEHFHGAPLPPAEPHSENPLRFQGASDEAQRVLRVVFGCCFCETVAVQLLSSLHPLITHPELHQQNHEHLRDEVQHSRLGWAFLGTLNSRELELVGAFAPTMVRLTRELWDASDYVGDRALVAHGFTDGPVVARAAARALSEVILPGLARAGVTTALVAS